MIKNIPNIDIMIKELNDIDRNINYDLNFNFAPESINSKDIDSYLYQINNHTEFIAELQYNIIRTSIILDIDSGHYLKYWDTKVIN